MYGQQPGLLQTQLEDFVQLYDRLIGKGFQVNPLPEMEIQSPKKAGPNDQKPNTLQPIGTLDPVRLLRRAH